MCIRDRLYAAIESQSPQRDGLKDGDRLREDLVEGCLLYTSRCV